MIYKRIRIATQSCQLPDITEVECKYEPERDVHMFNIDYGSLSRVFRRSWQHGTKTRYKAVPSQSCTKGLHQTKTKIRSSLQICISHIILQTPWFGHSVESPQNLLPSSVHHRFRGGVDTQFDAIRTHFQSFLDSGDELGASLSININGTDVVILWGGYADVNKSKPWNEDTLVNVWSTTKTLVSLEALTLVDKGLLNVSEKVSTYWPEFAANRKQNIEVRHLLSHTAGLAAREVDVTADDIYNTSYATTLLGYHAITYGYPLGEIITRVTGKFIKQYVADETACPLNANFQIGVLEKDWDRVAELVSPPPIAPPNLHPSSIAFRAFANPPLPAELTSTPEWMNDEIGASNGRCSASGLIRVLSTITLGGEVHGVRLLSPRTIDLIFQEQAHGEDLVLGMPITFGTGFGLWREDGSLLENDIPKGNKRVAYWGVMDDSIAFMDLESNITFEYVINKIKGGDLDYTSDSGLYAKSV